MDKLYFIYFFFFFIYSSITTYIFVKLRMERILQYSFSIKSIQLLWSQVSFEQSNWFDNIDDQQPQFYLSILSRSVRITIYWKYSSPFAPVSRSQIYSSQEFTINLTIDPRSWNCRRLPGALSSRSVASSAVWPALRLHSSSENVLCSFGGSCLFK